MLLGMMFQLGCMKDTPDCSEPKINISASPSNCTEQCTAILKVDEKIADKSTYDWDFQDPRIPRSAEASPKVVFPGPGKYSIRLTVTNDKLYCKPLIDTYEFIVEDGGPIADFSMTPATGICILGACPGTCDITFNNQSLNADRVVWTLRGQNGRGTPVPLSGNNPVLPAQFNQPDTVKVLLEAFNGVKSHKDSGLVIIRPETYVSKELDISGNSDVEEPFLVAENGGTIYIGAISGAKLSVAQVDRNGVIGSSLFNDYSANFSSIIPKVSAIKSNSSTNLYYLAAIALSKSAKSFTIGARIPLMSTGVALRSDTIGPPSFFSEGKCVVEKIAPSPDLLFVGLNRSTGSTEEIALTTTLSTFGFGLVPPRTIIKGSDIDYIIQDGTSYWAILKQRNTSSSTIENSVVQLDAGLKVIATPIFIGNNSFVTKRVIKSGNTILLIGNQSGSAQVYSVNVTTKLLTSIFSASNWVFNDATLINNEELLCAGANFVNGKKRAASVAVHLSRRVASANPNYYDAGFNNVNYSEITHINKFSSIACGLLLTGFVKIGTNPQASFFAKADRNGAL